MFDELNNEIQQYILEKFEEKYDEETPNFSSMSGCEEGDWFDTFFNEYTNDYEEVFQPSNGFTSNAGLVLEMITYFNTYYEEEFGRESCKTQFTIEMVYNNYVYAYCKENRDKLIDLINEFLEQRNTILK